MVSASSLDHRGIPARLVQPSLLLMLSAAKVRKNRFAPKPQAIVSLFAGRYRFFSYLWRRLKIKRMKKEWILVGCGLSAVAVAAARERPNVILLVADDLGYGDLSCYGTMSVRTPHVDSVARQGVRFTDAHAAASTSTPSRYGLLTGEYPFRRQGTDVAAGNAGMIIRPEQYTMADMFRSRGYATAAIGKWHLGLGDKTAQQDWNGKLDKDLADLGFDYHYIMAATADRVPCVFIEDGRVANYDPAAPIEVSYRKNFPGEPTGKENPELLTKLKSSHGHDMSIVNGIGRIGYMRGGGTALWRDEDIADSIVAHSVRFIERNADRPFFMYLCTNDVHVPRYPHPRFRGKSPMGLRGEAILQFDWTVGQITAALRRLGLADNTVLIITSDNGPVLDDGYQDRAEELVGDHKPGGPFRGAKYSAFEAGSVVPFIVSWPGHVPAGQESDALISQIDAVASLAALVGAEVPAGGAPDSENHLSAWLGKSGRSRDCAVKMAANRSLVLRTKRWKYIEPSAGGPMIAWGPKIETGYKPVPQLYDMREGAYEETDVAERHPKVVRRLQRKLAKLKASLGKE